MKVYVLVDEKGKVIKSIHPRWSKEEMLEYREVGEKVKALTVVKPVKS